MLTLTDLLGIDAQTLMREVWDQSPRHHAGGGGDVRARFTATMLQDRVSAGPIAAERVNVRGIFGREDVSAKDGVWMDPKLATQRVYDQDHALLISAAHTVFDEVAAMAEELEVDRRCQVRSNIFRSVKGTFAFPLHWDSHSLVAIQLEGSKRWDLFAPVHVRPLMGHNMGAVDVAELDLEAPTMVVELHPGDVLFVPRGWGHRVCTTGEQSVHITFGFHKPTHHDALSLAVKNVLAEVEALAESRAYSAESSLDLDGLVRERLSAALASAQAFYADADVRLGAPVAQDEYALKVRHFYIVREPVFGRARVELGQMRQDTSSSMHVSLDAADILDDFNRQGSWSAGALAEKSGRDVKLVERDLLEMVQKGLLRAPSPEVSHVRAKLV